MIWIIFIFSGCSKEVNYKMLRERMVKEQIIARGVKDKKVLDAMLKVPREEFVPESERKYAYGDYPLSIGCGQTISQPYIVALMTELLELKKDDRVLEIGTGSGYQAAILAEIAKEVYTIEIIPELSKRAQRVLEKLGYKNIKFKIGDGFLGWKEYAPFDKIIVTCAPKEIPQPLIVQLKNGGKLVIPVGEEFQELKVIEKRKGKIIEKNVIPVRFVPMLGIDMGEVKLPEVKLKSDISIEEAINKRRSIREYTGEIVSLNELSQVIWACAGKRIDAVTSASRVFPSAGAVYPLDFYVVVNNVYGLDRGIYKYDWKNHMLKLLKEGDYRKPLLRACLGQDMVYNANFNIIIVGDMKKISRAYGKRGVERYIFLDAGHSGENIYLQCVSLDLGTVAIGAFIDEEISEILSLEKNKIPIYVFPIGRVK
ncbi:MAG: hypothetical protein DRI36_03190 [Caldiserica bacterium]|nr:MAG: hypothetical protein DRI36_03190 [Caldisericota bacterium]